MAVRLRVGARSLVLMVVCTAGLHGCATTGQRMAEQRILVAQQWAELDATPACCESYRDIEFATVESDRLVLSIEPGAARLFPTGKSHFRGASLGVLAGEREIAVKVRFNARDIIDVPTLLRPSFVVLDADLNEIDTQRDIPICFASAWGNDLNGYFGVIPLDPERAWGLVAFTTTATRGTVVELYTQSTTAGGGVIVESSGVTPLPVAPVGTMEMRRITEDLRSHLLRRCPELFGRSK
jgi:hypothetical protein